jgi:hypothetical protein
MKRIGPPNGSGPRSGKKLRVAAERSHNRSDAGRASPTSRSSPSMSNPTASATLLAGTALNVVLTARGRSRFDVSFGETQIVTRSANPISDAARVLRGRGFADDRLLVARHEGAHHNAMSGLIGHWRKVRVREDRGRPRHVAWEARPRRVGAKKGRSKFKAVGHKGDGKNASTTTPGAADRHCPASGHRLAPLLIPPCGMRGGTAC